MKFRRTSIKKIWQDVKEQTPFEICTFCIQSLNEVLHLKSAAFELERQVIVDTTTAVNGIGLFRKRGNEQVSRIVSGALEFELE